MTSTDDEASVTRIIHPRLLIVEDEASLRELYNEIFLDEGFTVDVTSDGKEALTLIQDNPYDIILLDIMLPVMDGLEVLKSMQLLKKQYKGKILMLTNFSDEQIIEQAYKLGADGYLIKSELSPTEIIQEVESTLYTTT